MISNINKSIPHTTKKITAEVIDQSKQNPTKLTSENGQDQKKELIKQFQDTLREKQTTQSEILIIFIVLFSFITINVSLVQKVETIYAASFFMLFITGCYITLLGALFLVWNFSLGRLIVFILGISGILLVPFIWGVVPLKIDSNTLINSGPSVISSGALVGGSVIPTKKTN